MFQELANFVPFNPTVTVSLQGATALASDALMEPSGERVPVGAVSGFSLPAAIFLPWSSVIFQNGVASAMACAP